MHWCYNSMLRAGSSNDLVWWRWRISRYRKKPTSPTNRLINTNHWSKISCLGMFAVLWEVSFLPRFPLFYSLFILSYFFFFYSILVLIYFGVFLSCYFFTSNCYSPIISSLVTLLFRFHPLCIPTLSSFHFGALAKRSCLNSSANFAMSVYVTSSNRFRRSLFWRVSVKLIGQVHFWFKSDKNNTLN
jgi:hypothetical protein